MRGAKDRIEMYLCVELSESAFIVCLDCLLELFFLRNLFYMYNVSGNTIQG